MALDFPDTPTLGQVFTPPGVGRSWEWDGTAWVLQSTAGGGGGGGTGLPAGGTDEQVLAKTSSVDGEAAWKTITPIAVKATQPVAADYGLATIPVGAVWVVSP